VTTVRPEALWTGQRCLALCYILELVVGLTGGVGNIPCVAFIDRGVDLQVKDGTSPGLVTRIRSHVLVSLPLRDLVKAHCGMAEAADLLRGGQTAGRVHHGALRGCGDHRG